MAGHRRSEVGTSRPGGQPTPPPPFPTLKVPVRGSQLNSPPLSPLSASTTGPSDAWPTQTAPLVPPATPGAAVLCGTTTHHAPDKYLTAKSSTLGCLGDAGEGGAEMAEQSSPSWRTHIRGGTPSQPPCALSKSEQPVPGGTAPMLAKHSQAALRLMSPGPQSPCISPPPSTLSPSPSLSRLLACSLSLSLSLAHSTLLLTSPLQISTHMLF